MMRILLFGSTGKVGKELKRELIALHYEVICPDRGACDLEYADVRAYVRSVAPKFVINAAAFNGIEACETDPRRAYIVNAVAPALMAEGCKDIGAQMVHLSTDYVFDGRDTSLGKGSFKTQDAVDPDSVYSRSKSLGEVGVWSALRHYLIIRLSSIYNNTLTGPLNPLHQFNIGNKIIKTFDQTCCPTSAALIGRAIAVTVCRNTVERFPLMGTYHFSAKGPISRKDFALKMLSEFYPYRSFDIQDVNTIMPRPKYSVMDCRDFEDDFGFVIPTVAEDFAAHVEKIRGLVLCTSAP